MHTFLIWRRASTLWQSVPLLKVVKVHMYSKSKCTASLSQNEPLLYVKVYGYSKPRSYSQQNITHVIPSYSDLSHHFTV